MGTTTSIWYRVPPAQVLLVITAYHCNAFSHFSRDAMDVPAIRLAPKQLTCWPAEGKLLCTPLVSFVRKQGF